jgi:hypothetical protein
MRRSTAAWAFALLLAASTAWAAVGCAAPGDTGPTANANATRPVRTAIVPAVSDPPGANQWPADARTTDRAVAYPEAGTGDWDTADGESAVAGSGGPLLRFQVAVEHDITGLDRQKFADAVAEVLADPRSWVATGRWRLQRGGAGQPASFTVYLATPATRERLCPPSGDRYTSCRQDNRVVLNVARWMHGVPWYGDDLGTYRQYMINHEVGHRLGQGHELCTGPGHPAPVMQQQTLGLHGCRPNPWVMIDGVRYAGPSGTYDDPIPR